MSAWDDCFRSELLRLITEDEEVRRKLRDVMSDDEGADYDAGLKPMRSKKFGM